MRAQLSFKQKKKKKKKENAGLSKILFLNDL
jgi:hypothetical protein